MSKFDQTTILAAQAAQRVWAVPASVTLAQFAIESAYGTRMPTGSNNPFGIKALTGQDYVTANTHEFINGKQVEIPQRFRKFSGFVEAFNEHAKLLATKAIYAPAMVAWKAGDLEGGVKLMAAHYATAPNYAAVLLSIIQGQQLVQYDRPTPIDAPAAPPVIAPAPPSNWLADLLKLILSLFTKGAAK